MLLPLPLLLPLLLPLPLPPQPNASPFGRPAPELRPLFVPPHVAPQRYEVFVSDEAIDRVVERLRASGAPWPPGAWTIEREDLFDAFGADGPYRRDKLAWLYDGLRPRVARGPLMRDGRAIGGVTLISPYPDAQLRDLKPGTLAILVHVRTRRDRP